jgi:hypothetical protein
MYIGGMGGWAGGEKHTINFVYGADYTSPSILNSIVSHWDGTYGNFDFVSNIASATPILTIKGSGNVGIGTTAPLNKLDVFGDGIRLSNSGTYDAILRFDYDGVSSDSFKFQTVTHNTAATGLVTQMVIKQNGNVGIGTTSPSSSKLVIESDGTTFGTYGSTINLTAASGTRYHIIFRENGTERGSITSNGTTVAYNSVSDYRLKDITGPLIDSGTFIDALKPKVGTWKSDGSKFVGFLAHEFAEVSPSSVNGEKDAVDAEGNPKYQGMQASSAEVIANLVAELQSVRARLAALENN